MDGENMGIKAALTAIKDAWFTLSSDGLPAYRRNEDGTRMNSVVMAQHADETRNKYNVVINPQQNPYIAPDKEALAYA